MRSASYLIKPVSGRCNLACRYCFYRDVAERRTTTDLGIMSGEPTLAGLDFFREFSMEAKARNRSGARLDLSLRANTSNQVKHPRHVIYGQ